MKKLILTFRILLIDTSTGRRSAQKGIILKNTPFENNDIL